ncbi:23S rRNA (uracil(1939)-C(5))-methyltransferase RlmD [Bacillus sp. FJAT-44742]|uniref:23S rRNA (uracil(1939)-C(5))-methyltransferase RlmD n=1 Tax=Bacillus sp. FJAT-44742 TaxID=2014005 RepID=UPI000C23A816|nr:23S rRNA (uracil(1939)-C(5))-methyltransferase RlmD [Bacillus sp. FJAT-44742]
MNKQKSASQISIKKGQRFPLTIKRLGINGEGVGFFKRQVVFVEGALPGEEVVCEVKKVHRNHAEAVVRSIRKPSPHRTDAPCPVFEKCGGCQVQHLTYERQLTEKKDLVVQAFEKYNKGLDIKVKDTLGMDDPWHYRNKSQWQLGTEKGEVIAGLYAMDSHRLIDLTKPGCMVQHPVLNKVSIEITRIFRDFNIPIYNEKKKTGVVRTIVVRTGFSSGEVQVTLITAKAELPREKIIINEINRRLPEVNSVYQNIQPTSSSAVFGKKTIHLWGKETLLEELQGKSFHLSPQAFFQLNPIQAAVLYDEAKKAAHLTGKEKVVDAYCGTGTIGLWMADHAKEVRGMDTIKASVEDANQNAADHGYSHASFETGKAEEVLPRWVKEGWGPDVIIVDPPRSGCDQALLHTIKKTSPSRFVYVSCNPSTLAKDSSFLLRNGYDIEYVQPVDMFPQTAQVEAVVSFVKKQRGSK